VCGQALCGKKARKEPGEKKRIFDKAKKRYGGKYDDETVESVKAVLRVLPVFATIILYWAIYSQVKFTTV
jgi:hypothetical protein